MQTLNNNSGKGNPLPLNSKIKYFLLIVLSTLLISNAYSVKYYISNSGNDDNDGTSPSTAWKTIDKLNGMMTSINPGDEILFECGSVFTGGIIIDSNISGVKGSPIVFSSYGSGAKPVICGSVPVTGWSQYSGHIWSASVNTDTITQLFEGNNRLIPARTPNTGYYRIGTTSGKNDFTDTHLSGTANYWKNAALIFRLNEWLMEKVRIDSSSADGYVKFSIGTDASFNDIVPGSGYFIQNKFELIDTVNEWFFDHTTQTLYYYSVTDPSSKNIRASIYQQGIKTSWPLVSKYISIQSIEFREHAYDEVQLYGAEGFTVKDCNIDNAGEYGIKVNSDFVNYIRYSEISNNTVENSMVAGIVTWNVAQSVFQGNTVKNTGVYPAYGGIISFGGTGISLFHGDSLTVADNVIDQSGGGGLSMESNYSLVEKNIISNSMLLYSDGGAIYNNFGNHNIYRNNILKFTMGNMQPGYPGAKRYTKELYLDAGDHNYNTIENNTMYSGYNNAGIGLALKNSDITIRNNTVYKCLKGLEILNYDPANNPVKNLDVRKNTFFVNLQHAFPYFINAWNGLTGIFQQCDSNYLFNPFSNQILEQQNVNDTLFLDFSQWKASSGVDIHAKTCFRNWTFPTDSSFIVINETDISKKYTFKEPVLDLDHQPVSYIILPPFTSKVFIGNPAITDTTSATGVTPHNEKSGITVFPNPVNDILQVDIATLSSPEEELKIYSLTGQLLYLKKVQTGSYFLNFSQFANGMYLLKIGEVNKKIVVKH